MNSDARWESLNGTNVPYVDHAVRDLAVNHTRNALTALSSSSRDRPRICALFHREGDSNLSICSASPRAVSWSGTAYGRRLCHEQAGTELPDIMRRSENEARNLQERIKRELHGTARKFYTELAALVQEQSAPMHNAWEAVRVEAGKLGKRISPLTE